MLHPSYEQFDFLCIFGPSGSVPEWMYFSILLHVSHSVLLLCHDEFAMVSFLSSCLGSFSLERSTSCQVILEVFFEFLKWLNPPIGDLHRIYRIGHVFPYGLNAAGTALSPFFVVLQ